MRTLGERLNAGKEGPTVGDEGALNGDAERTSVHFNIWTDGEGDP